MRAIVLALTLLVALPIARDAQEARAPRPVRQHPVYKEIADWNGAVLESADITYRGTTARLIERQPRLVATARCCLLIREELRFDQPIPNLLPTEGEFVLGLSRSGSSVLVTIRLHGTSFCVNHEPLWPQRDGSFAGRVKAILPNENFFPQSQLRFDRAEQKGRWDLVTGDGTLTMRFVFRAGRPEDGHSRPTGRRWKRPRSSGPTNGSASRIAPSERRRRATTCTRNDTRRSDSGRAPRRGLIARCGRALIRQHRREAGQDAHGDRRRTQVADHAGGRTLQRAGGIPPCRAGHVSRSAHGTV